MKYLSIYSGFFVAVTVFLGYFGIFPVPWWAGAGLFLGAVFASVRFPREMFGIFLATVPLEIFPLVSFGGMDVRWYQVLGAALAIGVILRTVGKKESFSTRFFPLSYVDWMVLTVLVISGVSALFGGGIAWKQTVIFTSFVFLYGVIRFFVRNGKDVALYAPFLFSSFFVIVLCGAIQNILFLSGWPSLEVMAGRPNATFAEADWFGLYAALGVVAASVCILYGIVFQARKVRQKTFRIFSYTLFFIAMVALVLSVARSAWLAAFAGIVMVKLFIFFRYGFRMTWQWGTRIGILLVLSVSFVFGTHLSSFELGNRTQSVVTGLQEITVACPGETDVVLPKTINMIADLEAYDCRMINLEEMNLYKENGFSVNKIFRKDPNASIRKDVWQKSVNVIMDHPVWGVGWGNIGSFLGMDGRGAMLSSSNLFLEFWLGAGIVGFSGIVFVFGYFLTRSVVCMRQEVRNKKQSLRTSFQYGILVFSLVVTLLVFNMFNSAHFLMIVWTVWAFAEAMLSTRHSRHFLRKSG